jgi:hypothetical protein
LQHVLPDTGIPTALATRRAKDRSSPGKIP